MHMNKRRELIEYHKEAWSKYIEENPDHGFLGAILRRTCGYNPGFGDKEERFPVLAIPVTILEHPADASDWINYQARVALWTEMTVAEVSNDIKVFGVDCGKTPEAYRVFGERGIIEFLVGFKVNYIFGCVRNDDDVDIAHVGIPLGAIAFQAGAIVGEAFAHMVNEYGGGLRCDRYAGWNLFEAE